MELDLPILDHTCKCSVWLTGGGGSEVRSAKSNRTLIGVDHTVIPLDYRPELMDTPSVGSFVHNALSIVRVRPNALVNDDAIEAMLDRHTVSQDILPMARLCFSTRWYLCGQLNLTGQCSEQNARSP